MAETDALTGLANRQRLAFELKDQLAKSLSDPARGGILALFDLDHFKDLNDSLGHHAGDLLLKEIGRRLLAFTGPDCIVSRLGGDEFAALIPRDRVTDDGQDFVRALHRSASEAVALGDKIYLPSFSMGVTRFPGEAETPEGLMINADMALYEAKRNGRNQWCFFDPKVRTRFEYREHLKSVLTCALKQGGFSIRLQPISYSDSLKHRGFETLVRLIHEGEAIPPDHFVPLAEELGLIVPIGREVRYMAFEARQKMLEAGLCAGEIAINVAAPEFREPGFVEEIRDLLSGYCLPPNDLTIEITETALIGRSTETVSKVLLQLQMLGVNVSLDDFGTGFSSLSHLRDFRVNKLKIDKRFVRELEENEADRALVDGLIGLARRLELDVVAEGVENAEQLQILRKSRCTYVQGYLLSKPLTVDGAIEYLEARQAKPIFAA